MVIILKFKHKLFAIVLLFCLILSVGSVVAQDNKTIDSDIQAVFDKTNNDESLILENENQQILTSNHTVSGTGFGDIQNEIDAAGCGDVIFLNASVYTSSGSPITIDKDNLTIIGGVSLNDESYATLDAGGLSRIMEITSNNIVLKNIKFINANYLTGYGGAVMWLGDGGYISNCNFTGNTAKSAGAISWMGSNGTITNCSFTANIATENGGAMELCGSENVISLCSFTGNIADNYGGAIIGYKSDFTNISESVFSRNQAGDGGAIYMDDNAADTKIYNSNFLDNEIISSDGGAIYMKGSNGVIFDCNFKNNNASIFGGAISYEGENGKVMGCNFTSNSAEYGAAIEWTGSNGYLYGCIFKANNASYSGSLRWSGYGGVVSECNFVDNTAESGGAIYWEWYNGSVLKSNFTNNSAALEGGAIYWTHDDGSISNCIFKANSATLAGALYVYGSNCSVLNSSFISNNASDTAGAIYWDCYIDGSIRGCDFVSNMANSSGAVYWEGNNGSISDSTFTSNIALDKGGAISLGLYPSDFNIVRCNFTSNTANLAGAIYWYGNGNITSSAFRANKAASFRHIFNEGNVDLADSTLESILTISQMPDCLFYTSATVNITFDDGTNLEVYNITLYNNNVELKTFAYSPQYRYNYTWDSLSAGTYSITVGVNGANTYAADYDAMVFRVYRHASSVVINPILNVTYNGDIAVNFTVENKTTLSFEVRDSKGNVVRNGTLEVNNITISDLMPGDYVIIITNNESADYEKSSASASFSVFKIETSISSSDVSEVFNQGKYIVANLKDVNGRSLSKVPVSFTLNGKTKTYNSDANGQVKFTTNSIAPGKYSVKITFNGNEIYAASSKSVVLSIKKANPKLTAKSKKFKKSVKIKKYKITLKTNLKKPLKKVRVILKIKNKNYKATTNAKGQATFKINKLTRKGKYNAKVIFNGNRYYNKAVKKVKIIVK